VLAVLDTPAPGTGTTPVTDAAATTTTAARSSPSPDAPRLTIDALRVEYPHRDRPALASFFLEVPPGSRTALTGPSGSGKSTVLAALLGFVEPVAGTMRVDGSSPATDGIAAWRSHFSWVPQRPHLFHETLAQNLRLGAPDASDAALFEVLRAVGLSGLVANLPAGLETVVGHDGLTLSAGERQRIALARALLRPAPVLLLDEPTASLDPPTVERLAPAIEPWLAGRTVVVAAHGPVLLAHFDAVVTLTAAPRSLVASP
jgi:ABC-type transport system involved in cytochrome bd biosynthesis fused ATPase/permease subunit